MGGALARTYAVALVVLVPLLAVLVLSWNDALIPIAEPGFTDPGAITRYGLPSSRALRDLSAAVTIGALVLAATVVPPVSRDTSGTLTGVRARMLNIAAVAGSVWVWAGLALLVFTYADIAGVNPLAPGGLQFFSQFFIDVELGRALLLSATLAAVPAIGSLFARRTTTAGLLAVFAVLALWPLATTGHAAGALNHDVAVNAQMAHLLGVCLWAGGLAALLLIRRQLPDFDAGVVVARYSAIAGWGVVLVVASGVVAAYLRLGSLRNLTSEYGALVVVKSIALVLLVGAGWWQRRRVLPAISADPGSRRPFVRLAAAELAVMAVAMGVAVGLSRTPPPAGETATTPAEGLLGYPLPPPLNATTWLTQWRPDTMWLPVTIVGIGLYLAAVLRLRRRGDRWPVGRTVAWLLGSAMLVWATSGSPGVYGRVLFSMHMVQHMTIATATPTLLVLGAPVTLALRGLRARRDGSRGPREWLLLVVHSWYLRLLGHPVVAAGLFLGSLVVFYSSSLFELSLRSHTAHQVMVAHFLITGYLLASAIVGIDPGPARLPYPFRALTLLIVFGAHALYSVSLMATSDVLAKEWFAALGRTWGNSLQEDQSIGATLGWVLGDYPIVILGGALIWAWVRSDAREAKRFDRRADRDDDEELRRYNEHLQRLQRGP